MGIGGTPRLPGASTNCPFFWPVFNQQYLGGKEPEERGSNCCGNGS